ncbi:FGFR1 [Branchiostoma lanceolatum]|uniref:receptor protein-tyrosine kinase n=1 Tax=Branchiostoma lanceolatum TaxID=7740 RepID=A0A8J9YZG7_BRALA|nr:FGFR1 [Branchiostoma lanceolatum]
MKIRVFLVLVYGYWAGLAQRISLVTHQVPVLEHTDVTLNCTDPDSNITKRGVYWFYTRSEESLAPKHVFQFNGPSDQRGFYQWTERTIAESFLELTIRNVTVEDTGYYHCRLRGSSHHIIRIKSHLTVLDVPRITKLSMGDEGLNLTCEVKANPPAYYILLKKGNETLLRTTNESESNTATFTRQSSQTNNTGLYICVAENSLGLANASVRCETYICGLEERQVTVTGISNTDLSKNPVVSYLGIALGGLAVGILTLWVVLYFKRGSTRSGHGEELVSPSVDENGPAHFDDAAESVALVDLDDRPPMPLPRPKPRFPKYELSLDRLNIDMSHVIGRGAFAKVYKGTLTEKGKEEPVAIKTIRENATEEETKLFYEEIGIVIDIGSHGGVLRMRGCCTTHDQTRPLLVMEYMPYGDLLHFLEKCNEVRNGAACEDPMYLLEEKMKYQIGSQVAGGMQYICKQKYIHGDLAARNILVSKGQTIVVKISDFGLTADIYQKGYKRQDPDQLVPYKWISLERLLVNGRCTEKSDV